MIQENTNSTIPLVSVIVITYNSSKYVLETLESIKNQTYQNIELLISDDCSTDNTIDVCRKWIEDNQNRFVRAELITTEVNTGIPANCNRGIKSAQGKWIKIIAGDDILFEDAIERVMEHISLNPQIKILKTGSIFYENEFKEKNIIGERHPLDWFFCDKMDSQRQYKELLINFLLHGAALYCSMDLFSTVGLFDERFKRVEDHPFCLKVTKSGIKIHGVDFPTIKYRVHSTSTFNTKTGTAIFGPFYKVKYEMYKAIISPNVNWFVRFSYSWSYNINLVFDKLGLNKNTKMNKFMYNLFLRFSPAYFLAEWQNYNGHKLVAKNE